MELAEKGKLIIVFADNKKMVFSDTLFNEITFQNDYKVKDIINCRGYLKKDFKGWW